MIPFFTRLCIVIIAIIVVSFFTYMGTVSFFAVMLFLCIWVTIRSFEAIFSWSVFVAFFYSIMHYDHFALYFFSIVASTFIFDFAKKQIIRNRYESVLVYYFLSVSISGLICICVNTFYRGYFIFAVEDLIYAVVGSFVLFFVLHWIIVRCEKFVDLYTHGTDLKCHT